MRNLSLVIRLLLLGVQGYTLSCGIMVDNASPSPKSDYPYKQNHMSRS